MMKNEMKFVIHHGNDEYMITSVGQAIERSRRVRYLCRECLEDEWQISTEVGKSTVLNFVRCLRGEKVGIEEGLMEFGVEWECPCLIKSHVVSLSSLAKAICCMESIGCKTDLLETKGVSMLEGSEILEFAGCPFVVFERIMSHAKVSTGRRFEVLKGAVLEYRMWISDALLDGLKWKEVKRADLDWLMNAGGHFAIVARGMLASRIAAANFGDATTNGRKRKDCKRRELQTTK